MQERGVMEDYELWGSHPASRMAWSYYLPPRWWRLAWTMSWIWLAAYCLIYPSIPLPWLNSHWQGIGASAECRPWTAICEIRQGEAELHAVRGEYLARLRETPVAELAQDSSLFGFVSSAGKVPFENNCAGCHGRNGTGIATARDLAPVLNDVPRLHAADVSAIQASIQSASVHPFGLPTRIDEPTAKLLAVYVHLMSGPSTNFLAD